MPHDSVKHGFWHFSCIHARCCGHSGSDVHSGLGAVTITHALLSLMQQINIRHCQVINRFYFFDIVMYPIKVNVIGKYCFMTLIQATNKKCLMVKCTNNTRYLRIVWSMLNSLNPLHWFLRSFGFNWTWTIRNMICHWYQYLINELWWYEY